MLRRTACRVPMQASAHAAKLVPTHDSAVAVPSSTEAIFPPGPPAVGSRAHLAGRTLPGDHPLLPQPHTGHQGSRRSTAGRHSSSAAAQGAGVQLEQSCATACTLCAAAAAAKRSGAHPYPPGAWPAQQRLGSKQQQPPSSHPAAAGGFSSPCSPLLSRRQAARTRAAHHPCMLPLHEGRQERQPPR